MNLRLRQRPNPPSNFRIMSFTGGIGEIPGHQQGVQGAVALGLPVFKNPPPGGAREGNAADDALMVDQGNGFPVDEETRRAYTFYK
jgi:hypothetical protein